MSGSLLGGLFVGAPSGGGGGGTSDDVANNSDVAGATVTDALNTLQRVQYAPQVTAAAQDITSAQLNKTIPCNRATAMTLRIMTSFASVGDTVTIYQEGLGQAEFTAGPGVTLRNGASYTNKTLEQWCSVTAQHRGFDVWLITGDRDPV
jgi:hypothetical protein